jgi:hypothetical protein
LIKNYAALSGMAREYNLRDLENRALSVQTRPIAQSEHINLPQMNDGAKPEKLRQNRMCFQDPGSAAIRDSGCLRKRPGQ